MRWVSLNTRPLFRPDEPARTVSLFRLPMSPSADERKRAAVQGLLRSADQAAQPGAVPGSCRACAQPGPTQRSAGAVGFLDLDFFKRINDTRGHIVGDLALRQIAERVRAACAKATPSVASAG